MMSPRRKTSEGSFIGVLLPAFYFSAFTDGGFLPSCLSFHSHDLAVIERIWGRLGVLFRAKYHGKGEDWSNQSALRLCLLHVTSQLGEGCSMGFVRCVFLILSKTCVWNSFGAFSPMGFWTILQKCEVCWKLFWSTHMFICWRARKPGTRMKLQASCPNKEFQEGQ